jgi:hypothetical protein
MRSFDRSGCKEGRNITVAGRDKYTNKSNLFEAIHYQSCQGKKALSHSFNATFASDIKRTCDMGIHDATEQYQDKRKKVYIGAGDPIAIQLVRNRRYLFLSI